MSDIRTLSHLHDAMSEDFAWRRKELHALKSMVVANENSHSRDIWIRAAIALLYAHWEGFIRRIGGCYLEYVARQGLANDKLKSNFLAISVSRMVREASASGKISTCLDLVEFFRTGGGSRSTLPWKLGVNTKANLKSDVFQEIVVQLGLDYSRFSTKEKLLDEKLLRNRNQIAHGQYLIVQYAEYIDLHDEVLAMMQDFYNQVDNSAFTHAYRMP